MDLCENLAQTLTNHDQLHLVQFWEELAAEQQLQLQQQIQTIDFELLKKLIAKRDACEVGESGKERAKAATSPEQLVRLPDNEKSRQERRAASQAGQALLRAGKVGAILVAGGQGSRLGFDDPKGMFPIGPVSQRTLFQILCEQILARSIQAGQTIPYFIMTSEATHAPTVTFFQENDYFGLDENDVYFFQQDSLPAIEDNSHRILLAAKDRVSTSPDGHGGVLRALQKQGLIDVMRERGIEHLFYHQVDNPTAIVCDPEFLGLHLNYNSDLTTKAVEKVSSEEKMGVLVTIHGKTEIIEYSDLPGEESQRRDSSGKYVFWAGNTAIHVFRLAFLESLLNDDLALPFHVAHKKIPRIDSNGNLINPDAPNGNKFEQFIFDALQHARVALVVEGDREREFNPVKNAEGCDSPATSRAALERIGREWVEQAGGEVEEGVKIEISPLLALQAEDLRGIIPAGQVFSRDAVLRR